MTQVSCFGNYTPPGYTTDQTCRSCPAKRMCIADTPSQRQDNPELNRFTPIYKIDQNRRLK